MTAPTPNAALAYRVLDHIRDHPGQHEQKTWIHLDTRCGTRACFAGWASLLSGDQPRRDWQAAEFADRVTSAQTGRAREVRSRARELLGIGEGAADRLFEASNTKRDLGRLVEEIFSPRPDGAQ